MPVDSGLGGPVLGPVVRGWDVSLGTVSERVPWRLQRRQWLDGVQNRTAGRPGWSTVVCGLCSPKVSCVVGGGVIIEFM